MFSVNMQSEQWKSPWSKWLRKRSSESSFALSSSLNDHFYKNHDEALQSGDRYGVLINK